MKISYSARWFLCWALFIVALLMFVSGVFSFSVDWRRGLGLLLIGSGGILPTLWWLRQSRRNARVPRIRSSIVAGAILSAGGFMLFPWDVLNSQAGSEGATITVEDKVISASETPQTPTSTPKASEMSPEPAEPSESAYAEPETVTIPGPAVTVTEVETVDPPRVTVLPRHPSEPVPQDDSASVEPQLSEPVDPSLSDRSEPAPTKPSTSQAEIPPEEIQEPTGVQNTVDLRVPGNGENIPTPSDAGPVSPSLPSPTE